MTSHLSAPVHRSLDSGLQVICQRDGRSPVVAVQVWVGVGSADEDPDAGEAGLAHVHEHMLFKGTTRRGVGEIARAVEGSGGEINAWTSFDNTVYHVVMAARDFATGLDVLADAVQHSTFDPDELAREREVILEEIKRSQDIPARIVSQRLFALAFSRHPYGRPVIGDADSVAAASRALLQSFYRRHYGAGRIVVVVCGDVDAGVAADQVAAAFADLGSGEPRAPRLAEPAQDTARVEVLTGDTRETYLNLAWHIPAADHADVPALDVLGVAIGHGESSALSRALRFRQRLVNDAYAYAYTPRDAGLLIAGAGLHHDQLLPAARELRATLDRLCHEGLARREIDKAKTIIDSESVYQRETAQGTARKLGFYQSMFGDLGAEQRYYQAVQSVDTEAVLDVARRYLRPEGVTAVALLPRDQQGRYSTEALRDAVSRPARPVSAPRLPRPGASGALRTRLSTGLRVIVLEEHSVPLVAYRLIYLGGQRLEDVASAGHSNLCAQLLTQGTASRSALDIAHAVDAMAAGLDGFSGRNTLGLQGEFLARFAEPGFDLLVDCARRPRFAQEDLTREREQVLEQIRSREDDLASMAFRLFAEGLYREHPYRLDPLGTPDSLMSADGEALRAMHQRVLRGGQGVLVMAGDLKAEAALEMAEQALGGDKLDLDAALQHPPEPAPTARRVLRLHRDRAQAHVVLGVPGETFVGADRPALEVLSTVLSGQSGRLFMELRDRQSLAYSITALNVEGMEPGYFAIYLATSPDKLDQALAGIDAELDRLRQSPPGLQEVRRAQRFLIGAHAIGLQRVGARASVMGFNEIYRLGYEAHLDYARRIDAVSAEDLLRVSQQRLRPERQVLAVVGPGGCGGPEPTEVLNSASMEV